MLGGSLMRMVKCPQCELNYMNEGAECCEVCRNMLHGTDMDNETEICPECGEPFDTGKEMCKNCMKKLMQKFQEDQNADRDEADDEDDYREEEDLCELGLSIVNEEDQV